MCRIIIITLLLLTRAASFGIDLEIPGAEPFLKWDAKERRFSGAIDGAPVKKVAAKIGATTGWKVYLDPAADQHVSAQFTNRASGEALRLMLGGMNFAVVPQKEGPSKLFIFRNSMRDATEFVEPSQQAARGKDWIPNEVIVSLTKGSKTDIDALAKALGAKIVARDDKLKTYRLQFDSEADAEKARNQLATRSDARVDDNFHARPPENTGIYQASGSPKFDLTPDAAVDGSYITVAMIDTPVQDLGPERNRFLLDTINVAGAANPETLKSPVPTHGTSMADTIFNSWAAGRDSKVKLRLRPINAYGDREATTTWDVLRAFVEAVRSGADVVSMSLGGDGSSPLMDEVMGQARRQGVAIFAAAGNAPTTNPTYPAANPNVWAVTAADGRGNIAPYANRGAFIDFIAPGTSFVDYGATTYRVTGTSPATATLAGEMGLLLSQGYSVPQAEEALRQRYSYRAR